MAKVDNNVILKGASGMLGDQIVVRRYENGDSVLAVPPRKVRRRKLSPKQKAQQERFRKAAIYATAAQTKPEYDALAKQRGLTRYTVAVKDYLTPPEILGIDVSGYTGSAGQVIRVHAIDDGLVKKVSVRLALDDSTPIEKGQAVQDPQDPHYWLYTATTNAPSPLVAIIVDATDLAGQVASSAAHT